MAKEVKNKEYQQLLHRTDGYAENVRKLFAEAVNDILALSTVVPELKEGEAFSYSDNKRIERKVEERLRKLHSAVQTAIERGISLEWEEARKAFSAIVANEYGKAVLSDQRIVGSMARNAEALNAFIRRTDNGLNLSERVWKTTDQLRSEMELAMTVAIGEGESASTISRLVRQYLNNPDKLFRRIRGEDDILRLSKAAKEYHPGQGVYRSSAKNAMRIARTETNIAYRTADNERWQNMDFVLGQRIQLSKSHPKEDICDELAGDYPKDFVFEGWHPQCFCSAVPILMEQDKFLDMLNGKTVDVTRQAVTEMPEKFKRWAVDNKSRIVAAQKNGKLPYFIKHNMQTVESIINPSNALVTAQKRHAARTSEQVQAIKSAWNERKAVRKYGQSVLKYMNGISDVDTSKLLQALGGGDTGRILKEAKSLRNIGKSILGLSYLDNPMSVARQFSMADAITVNAAIEKKLAGWADLTLEKLQQKLAFEIDWLGKNQKYTTWEVAQKAYQKELIKVKDQIDWQNISTKYSAVSAFKTKSKPYLDLVGELAEAMQKHDKDSAFAILKSIDEKRAQLDKAAAARLRAKVGKPISFSEADFTEARKNAAMWAQEPATADAKLRDKVSKIWQAATQAEKEAAYYYTDGSSYINEPLRGIPYLGDKTRNSQIDIDNLTNLISRSAYDFDMWLQRGEKYNGFVGKFGVSLDGMTEKQAQSLVGMTGVEKGFFSCADSKGKGFSGNIIYNIYCPRGTRGIYAEPFSSYGKGGGLSWDGKSTQSYFGYEAEVILQRGTTFRITKITKSGNQWYVDLDVIGQD